MDYQAVFQRYELKYLLTMEEKERLLRRAADKIAPDRYGHSAIRNIYLDTPDFRLIRRSLEKPVYKEKLRIRSYGRPGAEDDVFVELKKKYRSVVYKRRETLPLSAALDWCGGDAPFPRETQIGRELDYFRRFYAPLRPAALLTYEREAYAATGGEDLRLTFDEKILARCEDVRLDGEAGGQALLPPDLCLMELKTGGGLPMWLVRFLSENRLRQTSYSKYGTAYRRYFSQTKGGSNDARYHFPRRV